MEQITFVDKHATEKAQKSLFKKHPYLAPIVAGLGVAGAAAFVGPLILAGGVATSLAFNKIIPLIYKNFHKDSGSVVEKKSKLNQMWADAQRAGISYEDFCKENTRLITKMSRSIMIDRMFRAGAVGALGFATFGVTGVRTGAFEYVSSELGDKIVYGEHGMQRLLGFLGSLFEIRTAGAAELPGSESGPKLTPEQIIEQRMKLFTFPDELVTKAGLDQLHASLPRTIEWASEIVEEYRQTMDMHDPTCVQRLEELKSSLKDLKALKADLDSSRPGTIRGIEKIPGDPSDTKSPHRANILSLYQKTKLFGYKGDIESLLKGAQTIESLKNGQVWISGAVQEIESFFRGIGVEFKYQGHWLMKPRMSRAFVELYHDIMDDPRLRKGGLRMSEAGDGTELTTKHSDLQKVSLIGKHASGDGADSTPLGGKESPYWTKEYVARRFALMYENEHIAKGDTKIAEGFKKQINDYAERIKHLASVDVEKKQFYTEMKQYYEKRLAWAKNPNAVEYYRIYYEPSSFGPPGTEDEVVRVLMNEHGMTEAQAHAYYDANSGNTGNTTAPHFHIHLPSEMRYSSRPMLAGIPFPVAQQYAGD